MKLSSAILCLALIQTASVHAADDGRADDTLTATIAALDKEAFDAFNHCDQAGQLDKHASYFAADLEFYHDQGGVTWTRDEMIANTGKFVCGHFSRELVPGSLRVYPIKDFGALEQGEHTFCQFDSGKCEGIADFVIVWRLRDQRWEATRVLSYGHRENVTPTSTGAAVAPSRGAELKAGLDTAMPRLLQERRVASVSIARIEQGKVILTAAYGSQEVGVPATPTTLALAPVSAGRGGARHAGWAGAGGPQVIALSEVQGGDEKRTLTGIGELDRVLGGGLVEGSVVLVGGDPGIGKSTLLLQAMAAMGECVASLYVTGEESLAQVAGRAQRLGLSVLGIKALAETTVERILEHAVRVKPALIVADSIQTLWSELLTAAPGSVSQVRESAARLVRYAKETGTSVFLVGHVTKEGGIAGPREPHHNAPLAASRRTFMKLPG